MTKYEHQARQLIGNWLSQQKIKLIEPMRHVAPRCYVVARPALSMIVFAVPNIDREPHLLKMTERYPYKTAHVFDETIQVGNWVASAYIITANYGETVAVAWPRLAPQTTTTT